MRSGSLCGGCRSTHAQCDERSFSLLGISLTEPELHQTSLTATVTPPAPLRSNVPGFASLLSGSTYVHMHVHCSCKRVCNLQTSFITLLLQFLFFSLVSVMTTTPGAVGKEHCLSSCITVASPMTIHVIIVRDSADLPGFAIFLTLQSSPQHWMGGGKQVQLESEGYSCSCRVHPC